jgi:hypothetical protein
MALSLKILNQATNIWMIHDSQSLYFPQKHVFIGDVLFVNALYSTLQACPIVGGTNNNSIGAFA